MQSYWFSKQSKINIIYNISVITITITMSIMLANFGKYTISDCPFILLLFCCFLSIFLKLIVNCRLCVVGFTFDAFLMERDVGIDTVRERLINVITHSITIYSPWLPIARPPHQPPVILSGTPELGLTPLTCVCWQINSILANIGHRNSIRILNQYPFWWNILIWA